MSSAQRTADGRARGTQPVFPRGEEHRAFPSSWSAVVGLPVSTGDGRLMRAVAVAFLGTVVILALYFGSAVLIPTAVAVLLAFILNPLVTWLRRLLPLPLAVALAMLGALACVAVLTVLVMTQLAEVAGSLTGYQANLRQKVQDVRHLAEGAGPVGQFLAMAAGLAKDLSAEASTAPPLRVQTSDVQPVVFATFVAPLLHPVLSVGIVVVLALFILLDRDHLSDKLVRLFGADVHATSTAVSDAAVRIARVLSLQVLTNLGFAVLVAAEPVRARHAQCAAVGPARRCVSLRALCWRHPGRPAADPDRNRRDARMAAAVPRVGRDRRLRYPGRPAGRAVGVRRIRRA